MFEQPTPLIHMMSPMVRPEPGRHFVLAYDETMDETVVRARSPDVKFITAARCTGRRLVFARGGATTMSRLGAEIYGVVWSVSVAGLTALDTNMDARGVRERRSAFARTADGLMLVDTYAIRNPEPGQPDPVLVLRVAELAGRFGFPVSYTNQIKSWLGASVH